MYLCARLLRDFPYFWVLLLWASAQILCEVQKPSMPAPVNTFFAANLQFKFDGCAMVAMGASNVHKCTRVYPHTYTCTWVHLYGTFVWYICTPICRGYANAWFCHYSPIHQIPLSLSLSLFHCTLIARLISLSDFACGYLCMRILPSTALSVTNTHTDTLSGNLSPHRPLPIGFCARARKSISNAFFAHFYCCCCCCVAVDVGRLKQQKKTKKQQKNNESQTWFLEFRFTI